MTYDTNNPLGSVDVRDLYDNAHNADKFVNGPLDAYPDRFGVSRQSLQGIRNASQYVDLGPYAAVLVFTSRNQVFSYLGNFYSPGPAITLPYTTTGAGAGEIANFRNIGDAVLRTDLASTSSGKGAALVAKGAQVVSSIAALRLLLKTSVSISAFVTGYYASGDGGGGAYYYDAADTTTADNGGTVIVAADGGRWKLSDKTRVTLQTFGAKPDGLTDCAAAFTAALAAGLDLYLTGHTFYVSSTITVPANSKIAGIWKKTKIIFGQNASRLFDIAGSNVSISGLSIDCTALATGSGAFRVRSDLASYECIYITDIETRGCNSLMSDVTHASNIVVILHMTNCIARVHRGPGVNFVRVFAYLQMTKVTIDYVGSASRNHSAFALAGNQGSQWSGCDTTGGLVDATTTSNHGFAFANCIAVWMNNCMADTVGGVGFFLTTGNTYFYMTNCVASLCGSVGFALVGGANLQLAACTSAGRKGQAYAPAADTFRMEGGVSFVQLSNCKAANSSGNGFSMVGATRVIASGCRADNSASYGVNSTGTNSCLFTGSGLDLNAAGNASFSSANMLLSACQGASGALISLTGPGTV